MVNWYVENKYNPRAHMDLGRPLISNYSIHTIIRIMWCLNPFYWILYPATGLSFGNVASCLHCRPTNTDVGTSVQRVPRDRFGKLSDLKRIIFFGHHHWIDHTYPRIFLKKEISGGFIFNLFIQSFLPSEVVFFIKKIQIMKFHVNFIIFNN